MYWHNIPLHVCPVTVGGRGLGFLPSFLFIFSFPFLLQTWHLAGRMSVLSSLLMYLLMPKACLQPLTGKFVDSSMGCQSGSQCVNYMTTRIERCLQLTVSLNNTLLLMLACLFITIHINEQTLTVHIFIFRTEVVGSSWIYIPCRRCFWRWRWMFFHIFFLIGIWKAICKNLFFCFTHKQAWTLMCICWLCKGFSLLIEVRWDYNLFMIKCIHCSFGCGFVKVFN